MFKSVVSVQLLPSQVSVLAEAVGSAPPKTIPKVDIPPPPSCCLLVFNSAISVHAVPFQDSTPA